MTHHYPIQVEDAIIEDYEFNFGRYVEDGFRIINNNAGLFIAFFVIYLVLTLGLSFIPFIGSLASSFIISPCLIAGFYYASRISDDNEELLFNDFFKGFDWLSPLLVMMLIQVGIFLLAVIPFSATLFISVDFLNSGYGDYSAFPWWTLLLFVPIIYLSVSWYFASFLIIFHGMRAWPAMEASRKIISKNWFMFFLFFLVVGIIGMLGFVVFGVGVLYSFPVAMAMIYASFRDIVGVPADMEDEDDILDHMTEL